MFSKIMIGAAMVSSFANVGCNGLGDNEDINPDLGQLPTSTYYHLKSAKMLNPLMDKGVLLTQIHGELEDDSGIVAMIRTNKKASEPYAHYETSGINLNKANFKEILPRSMTLEMPKDDTITYVNNRKDIIGLVLKKGTLLECEYPPGMPELENDPRADDATLDDIIRANANRTALSCLLQFADFRFSHKEAGKGALLDRRLD